MLILIGDRLHHEEEQDQHPDPVGTGEGGGVEEGEGGEEGATKGDEGGEGEVPLATGRVDQHTAVLRILTEAEDE